MYVQGPIVIGGQFANDQPGKLCWANQSVHLSVIIQYNSCAQSMLFFPFLLLDGFGSEGAAGDSPDWWFLTMERWS